MIKLTIIRVITRCLIFLLQYKSAKSDSVTRESEFLNKIQMLEETIRDMEKNRLSNSLCVLDNTAIDSSFSGEQFGDKPTPESLSQSLKLGKRDCVMEFHIEKVIFDQSAYDQQKTFVAWTMPFSVEDPLQHTDLAIGSIASYRHTSLYRLHIKSLKVLQEPATG